MTGENNISPNTVPDRTDPGDETQRNFRYQHAYGVILLVGAATGHLPYRSIWCEHHEDFLGERTDGLYDAYQIKTATPEDGAWLWSRDGLRQSMKRFVALHQRFPGRIESFTFVSNVEVSDSHAEKEVGRSPMRLKEVIGSKLTEPLQRAFDNLMMHCGCTDESLLVYVLERLKFQKGPGRDSFEDEVAHTTLSSLEVCRSMTAAQRNRCLDAMIQVIYRASSLAIRDPSKHWCAVSGDDGNDPYLRSKRIPTASITDVLAEMAACPFVYAAPVRPFALNGQRSMSILDEKLIRGGLAEYIDLVKGRALSAERHLIELAHLRPDEIDGILNQVASAVQAECDEARLEASHHAEPYGQRMLKDVHHRLRRMAENRAGLVHRQPYEVLAGLAGMLSSECRVWWSERFDLEAKK